MSEVHSVDHEGIQGFLGSEVFWYISDGILVSRFVGIAMYCWLGLKS